MNLIDSIPRFYAIEEIIGVCIGEDNRRYYKVKWKPSWERVEDLHGSELLIEKYNRSKGLGKKELINGKENCTEIIDIDLDRESVTSSLQKAEVECVNDTIDSAVVATICSHPDDKSESESSFVLKTFENGCHRKADLKCSNLNMDFGYKNKYRKDNLSHRNSLDSKVKSSHRKIRFQGNSYTKLTKDIENTSTNMDYDISSQPDYIFYDFCADSDLKDNWLVTRLHQTNMDVNMDEFGACVII